MHNTRKMSSDEEVEEHWFKHWM